MFWLLWLWSSWYFFFDYWVSVGTPPRIQTCKVLIKLNSWVHRKHAKTWKKIPWEQEIQSSIRDKPSFGTRVWLDMIQNEQKISWAKFHQRVQIHRTWVYKVDAMLHSSWKQHKECFWWYLMAEPSNWCTDHVQSPHGFRTQDAKDVSPSIHPPKMSSRV